MGIALYYSVDGNSESIPIAGRCELDSLWLPIIHDHQLVCLDQCVTAGLSIENDIYWQVLDELITLLREVSAQNEIFGGHIDTMGRLAKLIATVKQHPPSADAGLYIG